MRGSTTAIPKETITTVSIKIAPEMLMPAPISFKVWSATYSM